MILDAEQTAAFHRRGFVKLDGAFPAENAAQQCEVVWAELSHLYGIDRNDRATWKQPQRAPRTARMHGSQQGMNTARLLGAIDSLLGPDAWDKPEDWGTVLFTVPNAVAWQVPVRTWHWDNPIGPHEGHVSALHMFTLLAPLRPSGGATLFVEGMHHLTLAYYAKLASEERGAKHAVHRRRVMRLNPWLRQLMGVESGPADRVAHFMERSASVDGVDLRVHEMVGEPGDVYLLHPLLAHSAAPNTMDEPRIMRSKLVLGRGFDYFEV